MHKLMGMMILAAGLTAEPVLAGKVEITDIHFCCRNCVTIASTTLSKVDGVSGVAGDKATKTMTFQVRDPQALTAAVKALTAAGYYGKVQHDGVAVPLESPKLTKGTQADEVTVKGVHVCCPTCQKGLVALFPEAKVTFSATGNQKDVTLKGKDLDRAVILETLHKAGLTGKFE